MTQEQTKIDNFLKGRWLGMRGTNLPQCVLKKLNKKEIKTLTLLINEVHKIINKESRINALARIKKTKSLTKQARKDMVTLFGYEMTVAWYENVKYDDKKMEEKIKQEYNKIKAGVFDEATGY